MGIRPYETCGNMGGTESHRQKPVGFRMRVLLNVVAGEFLTEARCGAVFVLGLVEHGNSGIERCAGDEVLLPGDLVWRVRLGFGTGVRIMKKKCGK